MRRTMVRLLDRGDGCGKASVIPLYEHGHQDHQVFF